MTKHKNQPLATPAFCIGQMMRSIHADKLRIEELQKLIRTIEKDELSDFDKMKVEQAEALLCQAHGRISAVEILLTNARSTFQDGGLITTRFGRNGRNLPL